MNYHLIKKINWRCIVSGFVCMVIGMGSAGAVTPMVSAGNGFSLILKRDGTL